MNIVWFSWKDLGHPQAGGAERVTHELAKRLVADGHSVTLLTSRPAGLPATEMRDGYRIERSGGRYSVYWRASQTFRRQYRDQTDLIIEEINTVPFFTQLYARRIRRYLFVHQLARQIWFYQSGFPVNILGFLLEPVYLMLLRRNDVVTISASTRHDLLRHGFKPGRVTIISEGLPLKPHADIDKLAKYDQPTMLSMGSIRAMKRTIHQIKAFEHAKKQLPDLQLKVIGDASGPYGRKVLRYIARSPYAKDIEYLGRVDDATKRAVIQKCHVFVATSVREGWGLVVTESASQGTPAVAYNVHGLRDSIRHGETGYLTGKHPRFLAKGIVRLLKDTDTYRTIRRDAHKWARTITFDKAYKDFMKVIN